MEPRIDPAQHPEAGRLAEAFRIFNQASEELAAAYTGLQAQVARLTAELAVANGKLKREYEEKVALAGRLARNERLAAMGEMTAGLAHQLRTPLAAALLYAGALENPQLGPAERARAAAKVVERLQHLERLIRDMLTFARGETTGGETLSVSSLVGELVQMFEPLARRRGIAFVVSDAGGGAAGVAGNRKALAGALTNLLENALEACGDGGRIELSVETAGAQVHFRVRDDGRGMDAATQARLFEPFYTTRAEGTGLGLAIALGVARAHGGGIEVESAPGEGACFVLSLPRSIRADESAVGAGLPAIAAVDIASKQAPATASEPVSSLPRSTLCLS